MISSVHVRTILLLALVLVVAALATSPVAAQPAGARARELSGRWRPDDALPAGTAIVRLTYDSLTDPAPPTGVVVALVGQAADGAVTVTRRKTDARGLATFAGLDTTGAVAYVALAQLPRKGRSDRLSTAPLVPAVTGARVILAAEARTATAPPVDELLAGAAPDLRATPRGKVRVHLMGLFDHDTAIELTDASTGLAVAHGVAARDEVILAVTARAGQVLYADALSRGQHVRSMPFATVGDRGAAVRILVYPRLVPTYRFTIEVDDDQARVAIRVTLANNAWRPYSDGQPLTIPLPRSALAAAVAADSTDLATVGPAGLVIARPLPPGGVIIDASVTLPAVGGIIPWSLDLTHGAFDSELFVERDGVTVDVPPALELRETSSNDGVPFWAASGIFFVPGATLALTIHPPTPSAADAAVAHACRLLAPERHAALVGKSAPDLTLTRLDGKAVTLRGLRGKPVLVNFMATWDDLSDTERPQLATLAARNRDLAIVLVASDRDPAAVARKVGAIAPLQVVLDPPTDDGTVGPLTGAWGVKLVPESFLVDRKGIVRYYFANARGWSTPEAQACVSAMAARH